MTKPPKKPQKTKRDPAKPTRAKAARPAAPATPDALADLLNPAINKGTAGLGSGTGENSGLQPPPDNSFDRRADFSAAHKARKSTAKIPERIGFRGSAAARLCRLADHRARSGIGERIGVRRR